MKKDYTYNLQRGLFIPSSISEVWNFFSSPYNLAKITPAYMDFKITECPDSPVIFEGMLIKYRVKPVMHIPITWITKIGKVSPPHCFIDTQITGPYAQWEHLHTFKEQDGGVLMTDHVKYRLPLGVLGTIANALLVERDLKYIFDYREKTVKKIFNA